MKKILFIVFLFFSFLIETKAQSTCFDAPNSINSLLGGGSRYSIISADFNYDGKIDIVTRGNQGNNILVFFGLGNGKFNAVSYTVGSDPTSIVTSDFNGDGYLDLVVSLYDPAYPSITVLLGSATGTFTVIGNYVRSVGGLVSADFNNDGNMDLATASTGKATILLGTGTGSFSAVMNYTLAIGNVAGITADDFNGDGSADLCLISSSQKKVAMLLGTGTASFSPAINYTTIGYPSAFSSSDFNADGKKDLALIFSSSSNTLSVIFGDGTGNFNAATNFTVDTSPEQITSADFNGDGIIDLGLANGGYSADISILPGIGSGIFGQATNFVTGYSPLFLRPADFDNDGKIDIATTTNIDDISVLMNKGNASFSAMRNYKIPAPLGYYGSRLLSGDFNNDGNLDLAATAGCLLSILFGNGSGALQYSTFYNTFPQFGQGQVSSMDSADFNNDGNLDLLISTYGTSYEIRVLLGSPAGTFSTSLIYPISNNVSVVKCNDFNGDGNMDFAIVLSNSNSVSIYYGLGNSSFNAPVNYTVGTNPKALTIADFNSDGNKDIAVVHQSGPMHIMFGNTAGTFSNTVYSGWPSPMGTYLNTADLNNDNKQDLISNGVFLGDGNGNFQLDFNTGYPSGSVPLDYNGDGILDLIGIRGITSSPYSSYNISVHIGSGLGTFTYGADYRSFQNPLDLNVGDFNNDGKPDVAITNENSDRVSILINENYPFIAVTSPQEVCTGSNLTLNASGVSTFTWSTGATTSSIVVSPTWNTIYTVAGADANGCSNAATFTVYVNPSPSIGLNWGTICSGSNFTLVPNGASTYTYNSGGPVINPTVTTSYSVTGTDVNGCASTGWTTVYVNPNPTLTTFGEDSVCVGTSTSIYVSGANTYTWSTGVTTSSINVLPITSTVYTVTGADWYNCTSSHTVSIKVDSTCADVWPGDANSDGIADNLDVLELGLHYTQTGAPRAFLSNSWQSYYADSWAGTISSGKNVNHSDCNGDGTINNNDTLAIYNNYGLTHAFKATETTTVNSQLSIVPDQNYVDKGNWGSSSIYLGESTTPISNINGVAFTVDFDNSLIETNSIYIEYQNSFLDVSNQNLDFRKLDFANGKIYTATTHTVNNNVNGFGKIATLHYQIKSTLTSDAVLNLSLTQANQSNASGSVTPLSAGSASLMAIGASIGLAEFSNSSYVSVNPNPTNGNVVITSTTDIEKIEVLTLTGQVLVSEIVHSKQHQLDLENLASGAYFVKVYNSQKQMSIKKLVVQR